MTLLDDARYALRTGQRSEASRMLSRIIQREPTNGEAWFLLAEAVDDFQQQTYCMGMATRLGYNASQPVIVQPAPAPIIPSYAAPAQPYATPVQPVMPQIVIIDPRPREVDVSLQRERLRQLELDRQLQYQRPASEMLLNVILVMLGIVMLGMLTFLFSEMVVPLLAR